MRAARLASLGIVVFIVTIILMITGPLINGKRGEAIFKMAQAAGEGPVTSEIRARRTRRSAELLDFSDSL